MKITVAIVEDVKEIREGLQVLIDGSEGFSCPHSFASAEEAMKFIPELQPDVVLMDIHLPGTNGIEAVRRLKSSCPGTQFIMSTIYEDEETIFESLKAGATGYILKKTAPARLLDAIAEVQNGGSPMSSQIARKVIASFQHDPAIDQAAVLTQREKEVLKGLSRGLRYKEIADELQVSVETIRTHARHIYEKLQVQSRTEALNKVYGRS